MENNISVTIVGCGSIGSRLAMKLAENEVTEFLLMDNEILLPENAIRHLCPLKDAVLLANKVDLVKEILLNKFPKIQCSTSIEDILVYLHRGGNDFSRYKALISCVGNLAIERRLDFSAKHKIINSPIIYLWVEPYAIAGHMLYIPPSRAGEYKSFFNTQGDFLFSVLKNLYSFSKREAGCQTSFVPYSSVDSDRFVSEAGKAIIDLMKNNHENECILYTWLEDLKKAYTLGYSINDIYMDDMPFSVVRKVL